VLLFFETAFGICIGCWIYNRIYPGQAALCPGGACDSAPRPVVVVPPWGLLFVVLQVAVVVAMVLQQRSPVAAGAAEPRPGASAASQRLVLNLPRPWATTA
jgi:hypothetical protein